MDGMFLPFLKEQKPPIPLTEGLDPISMLTDDAQVASWSNEGLPADRMSKAGFERWIRYDLSFIMVEK